jgi:hypothetical protein
MGFHASCSAARTLESRENVIMTSRDNLISSTRLADDGRRNLRHLRPIAALLLVATLPACFHELPPPPTKGYGEPYQGVGKPIYVKSGRNDTSISEGGRPIRSEQALEATKDEEYEIRRQDAKKYNDKIYAEGQSHRTLGKIFLGTGTALAVAGFAVMIVVPSLVREETSTPATTSDPDTRLTKPGGASAGALVGGLLVGLVGIGLAAYGYIGGAKDPPYHVWKTPKELDRPAYIRERTEPYNEAIGAPPVEEQPGSVESVPLAPGQRKPPPERPADPKSRSAAASPGGAPPPPANSATMAPTKPGPAAPASSAKPGPTPGPAARPGASGPPGPPPPVPGRPPPRPMGGR